MNDIALEIWPIDLKWKWINLLALIQKNVLTTQIKIETLEVAEMNTFKNGILQLTFCF